MAEELENQIRKALLECADGRMTLDEFREWFVPISTNIEDSGEPLAIELAYQIEGILAEASSAGWSEDELQQELAHPFVASQSAESVVGDPSSFPVAKSTARVAINQYGEAA